VNADLAPPAPLHVVVVAYGPVDGLAGCLEALGGAYPVTVVDNSSNPEARLVASGAGAQYLDPGRNLGFAAGVNLGLDQVAGGHDVLLVNPDARVWPPAVEALRHALVADQRAGCAAPALRDPRNGEAERVCWPFPSPRRAWVEAPGLGRLLPADGFLIGAVLLLRAEALAEVGRLDERFFLYAEEVDWQFRARAAGWHPRWCPDVTAEHLGAGTGGDPRWRQSVFHASVERYVRKWYGPWGWTSFRLATVLAAGLRGVARRGETGRAERRRAVLYLRGPVRARGAAAPPPPAGATGEHPGPGGAR